jgi:hypothetical protein
MSHTSLLEQRNMVFRLSRRSSQIRSLTNDSQLLEIMDYEALFASATEDDPDTHSTSNHTGIEVYSSGSPSRSRHDSRDTIVWNPRNPQSEPPQPDAEAYDLPPMEFSDFQLPPLSR